MIWRDLYETCKQNGRALLAVSLLSAPPAWAAGEKTAVQTNDTKQQALIPKLQQQLKQALDSQGKSRRFPVILTGRKFLCRRGRARRRRMLP